MATGTGLVPRDDRSAREAREPTANSSDSGNIIWVEGGDYNPPDRSLVRAVEEGIQETDPDALQNAHGAPETAALDWREQPWLSVSDVYIYESVHAEGTCPARLGRHALFPDRERLRTRVRRGRPSRAGACLPGASFRGFRAFPDHPFATNIFASPKRDHADWIPELYARPVLSQ
ncbi:DUF4038 domain-containing protein [Mesorhizobium sp. CA8]|nr:DUF4038 domain-containing protein [Mesorhizobium sp. CA8]MBZ9821496.1 DUF4038 domain-containing protein [Mesorhizobium sp. CA4]